jgi:hypothetical protein
MSKKLIKVQRTGTSFDLKVGEAVVENTSQNINTHTVNVIYDKNLNKTDEIPKTEPNKTSDKSFSDEIIKVFQSIIIDDRKNLCNVLDRSGCVVVTIKDLLLLISKLYDVNESDIKINIEDIEAGCCTSKIIPLKKINSIKILRNNLYNDLQFIDSVKYNLLAEEYKISLAQVLIL